MSAVRVRDLHYRYGDDGFVLRVPALDLETGEKVVFTGPSGCGKTTLLNLLAGIDLPDDGTVTVDGVCWADLGDGGRRRARITGIGLVFQEFELLEHLSVRENILLPFYVNDTAERIDRGRQTLVRLARSTGIVRHLDRHPRNLSHGERQRVAICRALVTEPRLVLADEPTGNLDPDTTAQVLGVLVEEAERLKATVAMVTHDHTLLDAFDRVVDFAGLTEPSP